LQDLWSRLLAAAMDPTRRDVMRQSFVQVVKQMDPIDAVVLKAIRDNGNATWNINGRDVIAHKLGYSADEILVSFGHLAEMDCIYFMDSTGARIQPFLKPLGSLLMNVVSGWSKHHICDRCPAQDA
jgi:Abortive infection alpha